jgi:N-acetylneuraminic acid mutarotase
MTDFFNDMYYFDFTELTWHVVHYDEQRSMAIPTPRASHSLVYFPNLGTSGCFYMFGGGNLHQFFNDLFIFDIETRSWLLPSVSGEAPAPRAGHTATKIDENHFCVIGGGQPTVVFNDIYLFNLANNTWVRVTAAG